MTSINFTKAYRRQLAYNAPKMLSAGAPAMTEAYGADVVFP